MQKFLKTPKEQVIEFDEFYFRGSGRIISVMDNQIKRNKYLRSEDVNGVLMILRRVLLENRIQIKFCQLIIELALTFIVFQWISTDELIKILSHW